MKRDEYPELPYGIEDFREWLRSLPGPSAIAGYAGLPRCCPAAKWLNDRLKKEVRVDSDVIIVGSVIGYNTPEWLGNFVDKVDTWSRGADIGRRQALSLLTRAERIS
jgi:hypothetical protein